jgi:hypothetical protein
MSLGMKIKRLMEQDAAAARRTARATADRETKNFQVSRAREIARSNASLPIYHAEITSIVELTGAVFAKFTEPVPGYLEKDRIPLSRPLPVDLKVGDKVNVIIRGDANIGREYFINQKPIEPTKPPVPPKQEAPTATSKLTTPTDLLTAGNRLKKQANQNPNNLPKAEIEAWIASAKERIAAYQTELGPGPKHNWTETLIAQRVTFSDLVELFNKLQSKIGDAPTKINLPIYVNPTVQGAWDRQQRVKDQQPPPQPRPVRIAARPAADLAKPVGSSNWHQGTEPERPENSRGAESPATRPGQTSASHGAQQQTLILELFTEQKSLPAPHVGPISGKIVAIPGFDFRRVSDEGLAGVKIALSGLEDGFLPFILDLGVVPGVYTSFIDIGLIVKIKEINFKVYCSEAFLKCSPTTLHAVILGRLKAPTQPAKQTDKPECPTTFPPAILRAIPAEQITAAQAQADKPVQPDNCRTDAQLTSIIGKIRLINYDFTTKEISRAQALEGLAPFNNSNLRAWLEYLAQAGKLQAEHRSLYNWCANLVEAVDILKSWFPA